METGGPNQEQPQQPPQQDFGQYPRGNGVSQDEKTQMLLVWVLSIVIGIFSPIIFLIVGKDKPGVYATAAQCLTYQLCLLVIFIPIWLIFFFLGMVVPVLLLLLIPLYLALFVLNIYVLIMGIMASNNGQVYEPPVTGNIAKKFFKI